PPGGPLPVMRRLHDTVAVCALLCSSCASSTRWPRRRRRSRPRSSACDPAATSSRSARRPPPTPSTRRPSTCVTGSAPARTRPSWRSPGTRSSRRRIARWADLRPEPEVLRAGPSRRSDGALTDHGLLAEKRRQNDVKGGAAPQVVLGPRRPSCACTMLVEAIDGRIGDRVKPLERIVLVVGHTRRVPDEQCEEDEGTSGQRGSALQQLFE